MVVHLLQLIVGLLPKVTAGTIDAYCVREFGPVYRLLSPTVKPVLEILLAKPLTVGTPWSRAQDALEEFAAADAARETQLSIAEAVVESISDDHWQILRNQADIAISLKVAAQSRRLLMASRVQAGIKLMATWIDDSQDEQSVSDALLNIGLDGDLVRSLMRDRQDALGPSITRLTTVLDTCVHPLVRLGYQLSFAIILPDPAEFTNQILSVAADFGMEPLVLEVVAAKSVPERMATLDRIVGRLSESA